MAEKKITKRERFAQLLNISEVACNPELVAFIENEIELLARKNSSNRKPTKEQEFSAKIRDNVKEVLTANPDKLFTVTELLQEVQPNFEELVSNQRVSCIVRKLVGEGFAKNEKDKKKSYFALAK